LTKIIFFNQIVYLVSFLALPKTCQFTESQNTDLAQDFQVQNPSLHNIGQPRNPDDEIQRFPDTVTPQPLLAEDFLPEV